MKWFESLRKQIETLSGASDFLTNNSSSMEKLVSITKQVKGFHYFTGIGKNGFVAAKVASTFNSLGIRSMFVDPVNTLHGDMDIFSGNDILYIISKSGETEELIRLVQALLDNKFLNIVTITSKRNSSLSRLSKFSLFVPVKDEGDHLGVAPVASSLVYIAVLQSIAVEFSSDKGFSKKDFVRCHPGGALGKIKDF